MRLCLITSTVLLITLVWPLCRLWGFAGTTALRSAFWWVVLSYGCWLLHAALGMAGDGSGRWLGYARLLATVSALCPLVAVLGARRPRIAVWNFLVLSLLAIFVLPILEQALLRGTLERDRVGMDGPRYFFFLAIAGVGVFNYVPTRFGVAAFLLAGGMLLQSLGASPWGIAAGLSRGTHCGGNLLVSAAAWLAVLLSPIYPAGVSGAWLRLRDAWGLVWALRFSERWNAVATQNQWPARISWHGVTGYELMDPSQSHAAEQQFRFQLRRFADPASFLDGQESRSR